MAPPPPASPPSNTTTVEVSPDAAPAVRFVDARILDVQRDGQYSILTIDKGFDDGIDKTWTGQLLIDGVGSGETVLIRINRPTSVVKVLLTVPVDKRVVVRLSPLKIESGHVGR